MSSKYLICVEDTSTPVLSTLRWILRLIWHIILVRVGRTQPIYLEMRDYLRHLQLASWASEDLLLEKFEQRWD
jgi:hypothetical protein